MVTKIDRFIERVLRCPNTHCPYYQQSNGGYPKFSHGSTRSKVMMVLENPGPPRGIELSRNIEDVTVEEMRKWAGEGVTNWLFVSKALPRTLFNYGKHDFLKSYYITQAYRCPDPCHKASKERARKECLNYLKEEISLVEPKVILALGSKALVSVKDVLSPSASSLKIKELFVSKRILRWEGITILPIVHPAGYGRSGINKEDYIKTIKWYIRQIEKL